MAKIYVLHENEAWVAPLREAFAARGLPFEEWRLAEGHFDLEAPPPQGVFYNRMSASSHTRDHRFAPEYTVSVLAWLEGNGRRVVNGERALAIELSKVRQYTALKAAGLRVPRTTVAVGREAVKQAILEFGAPLILKPNRGGKGLGVRLYRETNEALTFVESSDFDPGPDGTVLVQEYIQPVEPVIVRNEFVGGKLLYAVRVDTGGGFELCPADVCNVSGPCATTPAVTFEVLDRFNHPDHPRMERFLRDNRIEVAGIEMIADRDGNSFVYDVNTNTNYNPEAEATAGIAGTDRAGMGAIASFLGRELRRISSLAAE